MNFSTFKELSALAERIKYLCYNDEDFLLNYINPDNNYSINELEEIILSIKEKMGKLQKKVKNSKKSADKVEIYKNLIENKKCIKCLEFICDYAYSNNFGVDESFEIKKGNYFGVNFSESDLLKYYYSHSKNNDKLVNALNGGFANRYANLGNIENYNIPKQTQNLINEKKEFEYFIKNYSNLSNNDFIKLYTKFYKIDANRISELYSQETFKNQKMFAVETDDYVNMQMSEGSGRDFSYWNVPYGKMVKFYADKDFNVKKQPYTLDEIQELVNNKQIYVCGSCGFGTELSDEERKKRHEKYAEREFAFFDGLYDVLVRGLNDVETLSEKLEKSYPNVINILRENLTVDAMKTDYVDYMKDYYSSRKNIEKVALEHKKTLENNVNSLNSKISQIDNVLKRINQQKKQNAKNSKEYGNEQNVEREM